MCANKLLSKPVQFTDYKFANSRPTEPSLTYVYTGQSKNKNAISTCGAIVKLEDQTDEIIRL